MEQAEQQAGARDLSSRDQHETLDVGYFGRRQDGDVSTI